jgi:maltose alpha-D-glucosyltransferase/alpha-amylase
VADLHLAFAKNSKLPAFAPEGFSALPHRSAYQTMRTLKLGVYDELKHRLERLSPSIQRLGRKVLEHDPQVMQIFRRFLDERNDAMRIRCHGDLHLGNVLWTGKDVVIVNFDGAPLGSSMSERRIKRCGLWDVASLLRSLHYATMYSLFSHGKDAPHSQALVRREDRPILKPWLKLWHDWSCHQLLHSYLQAIDGASFVPRTAQTQEIVLNAYLLERALRELSYEMRSRSKRVAIALAGILQILDVEVELPVKASAVSTPSP